MTKKRWLAAGSAAILLITAGASYSVGVSTAPAIDNTKPFYACVTPVNGNITRVSNVQKACPKGTVPISWNSVGPKGDKGDPGQDSSSLTKYYELADGTRYPMIESFVIVGGNFWQPGGNSKLAYEHSFFGYTSSDCSGTPLLITSELVVGGFKNLVHEIYQTSTLTSFVTFSPSSVSLSEIESFRYSDLQTTSGCSTKSLEEDAAAFQRNKEVLAAAFEAEKLIHGAEIFEGFYPSQYGRWNHYQGTNWIQGEDLFPQSTYVCEIPSLNEDMAIIYKSIICENVSAPYVHMGKFGPQVFNINYVGDEPNFDYGHYGFE